MKARERQASAARMEELIARLAAEREENERLRAERNEAIRKTIELRAEVDDLRRAVSAELRAVNCLARQIISLSLLASVGMLIAEGCHYAQLAVEKAVAVRKACVEIGAGCGVLHVQIVCCEIVGRDAVRLGAAFRTATAFSTASWA